MTNTNSQPILLVEDTPEDAEATLRAFKKAGLANPVYHCQDGDEALDFLRRQRKYKDPEKAPRPGMILLDLNMPGTDGREVLSEIKADERLRQIPVIVLTTSADERDIQCCYRDGANSYIQKPVDIKGFLEAIQRLVDYWYHIVLLPKSAR
ncbi:MAG TPA: response regulator [Alphaproteobacteria bacterium]|jgi:CheY-like chemotaxis protein